MAKRSKEQEAKMRYTVHTLRALKRAYSKAVEAKVDRFTFRGQVLLVAYAYYLIMYLEHVFKTTGSRKADLN